MASIVIAAHDEESVIGGCLAALAEQQRVDALEIIVSANGCTDRTAELATDLGAVVIDRPEAGKAAALNAGEAVASSFPRIYLDADIVAPPHAVAALVQRLAAGDVHAVVPRRRMDTTGRPWPVVSYFAINERLPAFRSGLFGRGMIALSERGRARFDEFPDLVADDLFLDSQFTADEKAEVAEVEIVVQAPYTTRALVRRLIRVRRGNAQMRTVLGDDVRPSDRWAWLRDVVVPEPRLLLAVVPYVLITLFAGLRSRRAQPQDWGRDDSTRVGDAQRPEGAA